MEKYIIIPGCSDLNRGDQALVWETKRLAEEAGYIGEYYLTCEKNEPVTQSQNKGIKVISPVLEHPSRMFKNKENIKYTKTLKLKWGLVAIFDLIFSLFLLFKPTRNLMKLIVTETKRNSIDIFEMSRAVFMKGGGILQTYGGFSSTYSMYFFVYPILLAKQMKKSVYIMPNSFGPFKGPFVNKIVKMALSHCEVIVSRESISQKMIEKELNIKTEICPDLAFVLEEKKLDKENIFKKYNLPRDKKLVGITMRPYRFPNVVNPEKAYQKYQTEMSIFIKWLYENEYMPVLVEHTLAINTHENDGECIKQVIAKLDSSMYRVISEKTYDCQDLKFIYGLFSYIVGTRFHSIIFSFGNKIPGIAISYVGNKSFGIMKDIGLEDFVIDIKDVNSKQLIKKFEYLVSNKNKVKEMISNYCELAYIKRGELIEKCRKI